MKRLCKKIDSCPQINMIKDKDMLDFQFAESVRAVCSKCVDFEVVKYPCKMCGKEFCTEKALMRHQWRKHIPYCPKG